MTRTTVSATRPDKTGAGEWIDIHSRTGRLMSTLMADGQPFSIDVTPDGMTTVTPLTSPKDAAQADGDNAKTGTVDGDPVALTPKEYDILRFLMRNAGTVFSPNEIYRRVWEDVPLNAAGAIAVHIRHLREKLEINPSEPRYIKVVWGKGYKMEGGIS